MSSKTAASSSKTMASALRPSHQASPASVLFGQATLPPVVLASQSPRRKELLETLGFEPEVVPANVDEALFERTFSEPKALATALSQVKCRTVAKTHPNSLVIAADTVVVVDNQILGKPSSTADAERMLNLLQGRQHQVISSISVSYKGRSLTDCQTTLVTFNSLDPDTIAAYVATGEPMDKAGAYAIQGLAGAFIESVDGCYFNVVGLSLSTLRQLVGHLLSAQN
ncbi:MAG: Maf family protein [Vampirovibrionales bacterium]|nr:Maf family protein [Vampirovibrionales bacterium]